MKRAHMSLMRARARSGRPARKWAWSSRLEMKGEMVVPAASGAGAPKGVQRACRAVEMVRAREGGVARWERMAQVLPSWGWRVVVWLSR
jgi:hypothetical protein